MLPICDLRWRGDSDRVFRPYLVNLPRLLRDWRRRSCVETEEEDSPDFLLSEEANDSERIEKPSTVPSAIVVKLESSNSGNTIRHIAIRQNL